MRTCITATLLLLFPTLSFAQVVNRLSDETAELFAKRFKPENSVITHNVIETIWNSKSAVISFYDQTYRLPSQNDHDQQVLHRIIAMIFIKNKNMEYHRSVIDTIYNEGGDPRIESVFFANADKDLKMELIIISSWAQRHLDVNGTLYATAVYDNVSTSSQKQLSLLKNISNQLSGGCECDWSDGTHKTSKYKTAANISEELKRLKLHRN